MDGFGNLSSYAHIIVLVALIEILVMILFLKSGRGIRGAGALRAGARGEAESSRPNPLVEVKRVAAGGAVDDEFMAGMEHEERVLFEVVVIDVLTAGGAEERARLRDGLIRSGYDEQCARRIACGSISDEVRAATVLELLQSRASESG